MCFCLFCQNLDQTSVVYFKDDRKLPVGVRRCSVYNFFNTHSQIAENRKHHCLSCVKKQENLCSVFLWTMKYLTGSERTVRVGTLTESFWCATSGKQMAVDFYSCTHVQLYSSLQYFSWSALQSLNRNESYSAEPVDFEAIISHVLFA